MADTTDTIVAAATPPGTGGVGIVRVSGSLAEHVARKMLGSLPEPRTASYRRFHNADGDKLDTGIALYFPAPSSFTGESIIEFHGHGGPVVVSLIVDAAVALGARLATPGEFTKRAFLNDKLDLVQAEAVADLIGSGTAQAARAALRSLSGAFSREVTALAEQLTRLRMYVEAAIDFPEEEVDFLSDTALRDQLEASSSAFEKLLRRATVGRVLRDGYRVVIVGKPNAGKSSLLNRLSGEEAAIVTEIAGTTRDVLREQINIDGLAVELVDTAGLRADPDRIEEEGIRRARDAMRSADALLWIQDAGATSASMNDAQRDEMLDDVLEQTGDEALADEISITIVRNKIDLTGDAPGRAPGRDDIVNISAKTGLGIDALRERIRELAGYENLGEGAYTARRRHLDALSRAAQHFVSGRQALNESRAGELLAEELRLAHQDLGEITGVVTPDDLLGRIFSEFCIGK